MLMLVENCSSRLGHPHFYFYYTVFMVVTLLMQAKAIYKAAIG